MRLTIARKLGLGFGTLVAAVALIGLFSLQEMSRINGTTEEIATRRLFTLRYLTGVQDDINAARRIELTWMLMPSREEAEKYKAKFDQALQKLLDDIKKEKDRYEAVASDEERQAYQRFEQTLQVAINEQNQVNAFWEKGKLAEARTAAVSLQTQIDGMFDAIGQAVGLSNKEADAAAQQAAAEYAKTRLSVVLLLAISLAGGIFLTVSVSRSIVTPLTALFECFNRSALGDLTARMRVSSRDEVGRAGEGFNTFMDSLQSAMQAIRDNSQSLREASEEFSAVSHQISANSEETSAQANAVSSATEQVNRGLQTVATATEEMSASIKEIAKNATEAAKVADGATKTATETNAIVAKLGESSAEIGQVIKVITSIAQKTDLLALNATVEAARAGEVGAGFAVVANEVKELAKQTATATEDISRRIATIQSDAKGAVQAIALISGIIGQVNEISGTIATAVEEQSATTNEMSRNVTEAARGAEEVAQNIQGVAQAAQSTSQGATDSQKTAKSLAEMSTHLRELVGRFKLNGEGEKWTAGAGGNPRRADVRARRAEEREEELAVR